MSYILKRTPPWRWPK